MTKKIFIFSAITFLLTAVISKNAYSQPSLSNPSTLEAEQWIDSVMNSLSLREKIAQLFMVAAYSNRDSVHVDEISALVREEKIGGLCFFQGGPVRQAQLTNHYQKLANVPLLISMDAEWGLGMRLDSTLSYPRQMMLGAADDTRVVYQMGADIAGQLKRLGVHVNFAPVVDVNNNPLNPVINTRSFGEDRETVSQKGLAYMLGLQDNGILACAKHFPGHGNTDSDSHLDLPTLNHDRTGLDSVELYPFVRLIQNGVASVMVAHLEIPNLEPRTNFASSLSNRIVDTLLAKELGFNGLIFTDALNMKGVSSFFKPVELNYLALLAGNDILLYPSEVKASIANILLEVENGNFSEEEINRRCRKIIAAKYRVGLNRYEPIDTKNLVSDLNKPSSTLLIRQITEQGITVLSNNNLLPLKRLDTLSIAYLEVGKGKGVDFLNQLQLYGPISSYSIESDTSKEQLQLLENKLKLHNLVIIGYHNINSRPAREFGLQKPVVDFVHRINSLHPTILCLFGSPYALSKFPPATYNGLIVAYDNSPLTQNITAQLIFGGVEVSGRLPVSISSSFPMGNGSNAGGSIRLKYSIPEELNISSAYLTKIDSIALDAITQEASPGFQILAAKDGVVFYHKSFGNFTYTTPELKVDNNSVYDVASLTKIASTLPAVMHLYSKGLLNLENKIGDYVSFPDSSKYKKLIIKDILLHQAGLVAWIPFYQKTLSSLIPNQPLTSSTYSPTYSYQLSPTRFLTKNSVPSSKYYRSYYSYEFPIKVAENLYAVEGIKDTIFSWMLKAPLQKPGNYLYSDLGFIMLHRAIGNITQIPNRDFLDENFYKSLGMNVTCFNPLDRFEQKRIVPTENDVLFRKQLLWGYVHDPATAMVGGVDGQAGLFSTANDLAKMLQMYLNKGKYGGFEYFPESTIELFTSCVNCHNGVRRGLGFDKPELDTTKQSPVCLQASPLSFGHTGFTGTIAWVDPAYNLVYILLSNRIYPDAENKKLVEMNVRTKIQEVLYQAIKDAENN